MKASTTVRALSTALLVAAGTLAGPAATAATAQSAAAEARAMDFTQVHVWATGVNVRNAASGPAFEQCKTFPSRQNCQQVKATVSQTTVTAYCQKQGERITDSGYSSGWWTYLKAPNGEWGWVNNVYITGDEHLAHVSDCDF
ncbi:SH3 domain-containing protein [Streptomyces geranii]|uniref:SH3 domain-containing protein n=1 Tax=Streptomyces geranii TaxID=2058923 RepID=UPI000D0398DA|nr:SH3 domain-containing protein [Streptomyces geranii]